MAAPTISDVDLDYLLARIHPVLRDEKGRLCLLKGDIDPRYVSFIWNPKLGKRVKPAGVIKEITTKHSYAHPSLFKPSLAEVIAQIPTELREQVTHFELESYSVAVVGDYHLARVFLYGDPARATARAKEVTPGPRVRLSGLAARGATVPV